MKRVSAALLVSFLTVSGLAQKNNPAGNTLLWKISGNGLAKPSYLFGTIHMLCKDDAVLSDNLKNIIHGSDEVYFEVDLDNMLEMLGVMSKMKMRGDTTLRDLLTEKEYEKVKTYFESKSSMFPFSMLETYKPILAASVLEQNSFPCETTAMMEQVIMAEAKQHNKKIKGMETMGYQVSVLDDIPYKLQAEQLVKYIDDEGKDGEENKEMKEMLDAYKDQDLAKLEALLSKSDIGMSSYAEILLYKRNRNWVEKLKEILPGKTLLVAVGAGHLPGKQGVISLLKKAGFTVIPVENKTKTGVTI
jgi:uncharacterized protein